MDHVTEDGSRLSVRQAEPLPAEPHFPFGRNVHFHTLVPDGVFDVEGTGPARFVPVRAPGEEELTAILGRIVRRTAKALVGYDEAESEADALAALQAAEVDRRLRFPDPFKHARRSAFLGGFSLHAGVRIHERDREGLERLCRYAVRPPFSSNACRAPRTDGSSTG